MKITICSPSYRRPRVETLDIYPHTRIYVAESEYEDYKKANPEGSDIVTVPDEVQGNLCRVRNYILDTEFEAGTDGVLMIDDDMKGIYRFNAVEAKYGLFGYKKSLLDEEKLFKFVENGFELCDEWGFKFWGVNVLKDNRAYRHYNPFSTTSYIGGPFQAHLNNPLRYDERLPLKDDYDITLQHLNKYRGVLRFNAYHYDCKQSKQAGGCANMRNIAREKQQFEALQRKWGNGIVKQDKQSLKSFDYNPIVKVPIKGI